jgi:hypothetical protein
MSGRRACKRVKHFGLDFAVPGVLSATRKQTRLTARDTMLAIVLGIVAVDLGGGCPSANEPLASMLSQWDC